MSSHRRADYDAPDWLPDATSDEARQQTLDLCGGDVEQAQLTAYMSGYFEGEGCVKADVSSSGSYSNGFEYDPRVEVQTAQVAGVFDAEGSVQHKVGTESSKRLNYEQIPEIRCIQNQNGTILEELFQDYCDTFGIKVSLYKRAARDEVRNPTVAARIRSPENIRKFLSPLLPLLREKRRQAVIMLREILPRYEEGKHLTKEGFIELMRWKRELDREKPMGDEDRKYTVGYFEDLWGGEIEQQRRLGDFRASADD